MDQRPSYYYFKMGTFRQDVLYGLRMLRKNPGFSAVAILTLAIGIGANTAIFSVVNAVLLRPLPFRNAAELFLLLEHAPDFTAGPSYQNFADWKAQSQSFSGIAAVRNTNMTLTGAGEPERLDAQLATANLMPLLGVAALKGHTFTTEEDRAGAPNVAILSYGLWQRRFGGAQDVLGKSITLDNQPYTVAGVLPPGFQLIRPADIMVPFEPWAKKLPDDRSWHPGILAIGRLKPGITVDRARSEMTTIAKRLELQYPVYDTGVTATVTGLQEQFVQNVRPALLVLLGAVALVLLIACANVANLLLARANSRRREIAIRSAMGAARLRILRQLLVESLMLALCGGAVGVLLAWAGMWPLVRLAGTSIPNVGPIGVDRQVLLFAAAVAVAAGILFGLAPAMQISSTDLRAVLNEASRGSTGGSRQRRFRSALVVLEIGLALVLLVGAGLLLRSFERLQNVEPGFHPGNLLVADVPVSPVAYKRSAERMAFFERILERSRAMPGVSGAGAAVALPVSAGGMLIHFNIEGRPPKSGHDYIVVGARPVSPKYLDTLGVPLVRGRLLNDSDSERGPFVAVVNRAMARRFFPNESALGKHVQLGALPERSEPWMEIVGVVGDMKQNLATEPAAEMYMPLRQFDSQLPVYTLSFVLRTQNDPRSQAASFRGMVRELDPNQPVVKVRTMEENIAVSVSEPRFRTTLLAIFGVSALLLAVIGLYGLMSYTVMQRVQEIGIRLTLGAQKADVLRMIVGQGLALALAGVASGAAGAYWVSNLLAKFLFGVSDTDPLTYISVALLLIAVSLAACYFPARRAAQVDPMVALRYE